MAKLTVIFFGDLRRVAGTDKREIELPEPARVSDVARAAGIADTAETLVVVNGKTAPADAPVADGDEVAFFPRVAGGVL
jgi:molybdopterin converting factor small subunit